jgi:hypothetical protein
VGPGASLDAGARREILCPCRGLKPDRPAPSQTLYCLSYHGSPIPVQQRLMCNENVISVCLPTSMSYLSLKVNYWLNIILVQ